jgi:hypothetical protein
VFSGRTVGLTRDSDAGMDAYWTPLVWWMLGCVAFSDSGSVSSMFARFTAGSIREWRCNAMDEVSLAG